LASEVSTIQFKKKINSEAKLGEKKKTRLRVSEVNSDASSLLHEI